MSSNSLRTRQTLQAMAEAAAAFGAAETHLLGSLYTVAALDGQTPAGGGAGARVGFELGGDDRRAPRQGCMRSVCARANRGRAGAGGGRGGQGALRRGVRAVPGAQQGHGGGGVGPGGALRLGALLGWVAWRAMHAGLCLLGCVSGAHDLGRQVRARATPRIGVAYGCHMI